MADASDPIEPDEPVPSTSDVEGLERALLFRHQLFFMLGIFVFIVVGFFAMSTRIGALIVTVVAGTCWTLSGVYAMRARRHMFAGMRWSAFGNVTTRPSKSSPLGATIVGVILMALGTIGFGNLALWLFVAR